MKRIKRARFRGKAWRVEWRRIATEDLAVCDGPEEPQKRIIIDPKKNGAGLNLLDTAIHEALHACYWDLDEDAIGPAATDIAKFLWDMGWRIE